jgi:hypothetical protein
VRGSISGAHGTHIKSNLSISGSTLLERLGDRELFAKKIQAMIVDVFFLISLRASPRDSHKLFLN